MATVKVHVKLSVPVKAQSNLNINTAGIKAEYENKLNAALNRYKPVELPKEYEKYLSIAKLESAAYVVRTIHNTINLPAATTKIANGELRKVLVTREEKELLDWARRKNLFQDQAKFTQEWIAQGRIAGAEQQVILNKNENTVTKRKRLLPDETWLDYMNRVSIHNKLSPSAAYEFKGFTEVTKNDGKMLTMALAEQPYIEGRSALSHEIERHMYKLGFEKLPPTAFSFYKDKLPASLQEWVDVKSGIVISDLHAGNVLTASDGAVSIIDPMIEILDANKLEKAKELLDKTRYTLTLQSYDIINKEYVDYGFVTHFGKELQACGIEVPISEEEQISVTVNRAEYTRLWDRLQKKLTYMNTDKFKADPKDNVYHINVSQTTVA